MEVKLDASLNALVPIVANEEFSANVTVSKPAAELNALSLILVTLAGILMEVKDTLK
jgi:hypothetical protein